VKIGKTGDDFLNHVKNLSKNCCIENLIISGHGWAKGRGSGVPSSGIPEEGFVLSKTVGTYGAGARDISDLRGAIDGGTIKFCNPCRISIYACRISDQFIKSLSEVTGCTVTAAGGSCSTGVGGGWTTGRGNWDDPRPD